MPVRLERSEVEICCRTTITPYDYEVAKAILSVGQFTPTDFDPSNPEYIKSWTRLIPEEGAAVHAYQGAGCLELTIKPSISAHEHHLDKVRTAGVYFEIAARYAEKVDGEIVQRATVKSCLDNGGNNRVLANYAAGERLDFEKVCNGFKVAMLGEHEHE